MSFLTGGDSNAPQYKPPGFSGGGLNVGYSGGGFGGGGNYNVTADPNRTDLVGGLSGSFGDQADILGGLRATVAPGYNDLLKTRLASINDSASKAVGDLRQNLESRRVLGSSFGQDTITRANAEFSKQRDAATTDSFLQSLQANRGLIADEFTARTSQFKTGLDELNLEANIAQGLTNAASTQFAANARLKSVLDEKSASGAGQFIGKVASIAAAPFTGGASLALLPAFSGGGSSATNPASAGSLY